MSAWFESDNLSGCAKWMRIQSQEEYAHAMKIFDYILQLDSKVKLAKIEPPKLEWKSPLDVFEETYKHEVAISASINEIVDTAFTEKDFATANFLQWFISEQVEEESTAMHILEKVKLVGDNRNGLFLLDRELGFRASK